MEHLQSSSSDDTPSVGDEGRSMDANEETEDQLYIT